MALLGKVRWADFLSPDSDVPPDVFFLVHGEGGEVVKIAAHKLLLAGVSPVFAKKFFGPMKDTHTEVEVEVDTSPEAFGIMIDFIYSQETDSERIIKKIATLKTMFELYHLADYYDIEKLNLKTKIEDLHDPPLRSFVTKETLTDCASVASGYKEIFPEFAKRILLFCLEVYFATFPRDIPEELVAELKDAGKSAMQLPGIKTLSPFMDCSFHYIFADWGDLAYLASRNFRSSLWNRCTIDEWVVRKDLVMNGRKVTVEKLYRRIPNLVRTWSNQTPIPKISSSWKIFVAAHLCKAHTIYKSHMPIWVKMTAKDTSSAVTIKVFSGSPRALFKTGEGGTTTVDLMYPLEGISRHKIELIHQEEGNNYSLSAFVDNMEVGKTSCSSLLLSNLTDVRITWGEAFCILIRDLGVLHK